MNEEHIKQIIAVAIAEANAINTPITISVVDMGGHLIALWRMAGCSYFGVSVSRQKAVTASQLKAPTHVLSEIGLKVPALQQAFDKNPDILTISGGFPLIIEGQVVGGVGISGGDFEQDKAIGAKAAQAITTPPTK